MAVVSIILGSFSQTNLNLYFTREDSTFLITTACISFSEGKTFHFNVAYLIVVLPSQI